MSFLKNTKVCFKEENLPITYHSFHYKVLPDLKVKLRRISTHKLQGWFFTERSDASKISPKKIKLTKISGRKLRSDPYLHPKWPKITNIYLTTYMDNFFYRTVVFILAKKVTSNLPKIFSTKVWSDPTVNPKFVKDFNP